VHANDTLDLIDSAIADYETSGDAMRWSPPSPPPTDVERMVRAGVGLASALTTLVLTRTPILRRITWLT
jgi:hypothetical protein